MECGVEDVSVSLEYYIDFEIILIRNRGLQHSATPEEIDDVEKYLTARIPPIGEKL